MYVMFVFCLIPKNLSFSVLTLSTRLCPKKKVRPAKKSRDSKFEHIEKISDNIVELARNSFRGKLYTNTKLQLYA